MTMGFYMNDEVERIQQENNDLRDILMHCKEWIAASEEHVLKVAVDVFGGVIGDSAERLLAYSPELLEEIRDALAR